MKRLGVLLGLVLLGGLLAFPSPSTACSLTPLTDCVTSTVNGVKNDVNLVTNRVGQAGNIVATRFALAAYPIKYLVPTGAFLPGGAPGMYVNTQQTVASNGCDPYPPTSGSCHEYWAGAKWDSPYRQGAYQIEWTIFFWTDAKNKYITSTQVRCRDWPSGSRWSTDQPCFTGSDAYANATINWDAHYNYKQSLCPAAPSIYAHEDIYAQVHANRSIDGTWYHYESAGC